MTVVVRQCNKTTVEPDGTGAAGHSVKDVKVDIDGEKPSSNKKVKTIKPMQKWKSFPNSGSNSFKGTPRSKKLTKNMYSDILEIDGNPLPMLPEEEEAVGIITMEDVIEELLQKRYSMKQITMSKIIHDICSMWVTECTTAKTACRISMLQVFL